MVHKTIKSQPLREKNPDHCKFCYGYGFWPYGDLCGIGKLDAGERGKRVIKCPWCGKGHVDKGERWDVLVKHKKKLEEFDKKLEKKE